MFIDLTRLGGVRTVRVRAEAIAYLDNCDSGCNVKLVGGETLRVNEGAAEIEALIEPPSSAAKTPARKGAPK